ncbi:hypothetical protein DFR52_105296 [Hoeflea marina]|uniref:Uncharacterized protein n=1 Tax=Hoeflea marina TaxID=274592 RepID=A0A317PJA2_9HYPH|nr:hypothetical protein [Hoeflea marina]PWV98313.1 hypothetical protein DFR52_105296 [Hoeflea marina]
MQRILLIALVALIALPSVASAERDRTGRKLDAIQSGRLYDPILTPQMNPRFEFNDPNAEAKFLLDVRQGRFDLNRVPEGQRQYFQFQLENAR